MTRPAWWAVASSAAAPMLLIGGWVIAQAAQPPGFSAVSQTISALAREGLDHRWIMTLGLAGLGVAHVVTAAGLTPLGWGSRAVLAVAGAATALVAAFPQPATGSSTPHEVCAAVGFVALAVWPVSALGDGPWTRRRTVAGAVTVLSTALLAWFAVTLGGDTVGLSERVLTAQQAVWPLVVVLSLRVRGTAAA